MSVPDADKPAALILAAGASRRLGSPKQLVHVGEETLLRRAVRLCKSLRPGSVHVVLGAHAPQCRNELEETGALCHDNPSWRNGMGSSLAFGVAQITAEARPCAILVMHVDQYRLTQEHLENLLERWRDAPDQIAAAAHSGTVGPPAVFPRRFFPILKAWSGDMGAKRLLDDVTITRVPMQSAAYDLDTPEDLDALRGFAPGDTREPNR